MLSLSEQAQLVVFKRALEGQLGGRLGGLVLFGSRARGEGHEDSDLDVLVLVRGLVRADRAAILDLALDLEEEGGPVIAPLVRDPAGRPLASSLAGEIARDGVPL